MTEPTSLFAANALLPDGWARDVLIEWNPAGLVTGVAASAICPPEVACALGPLIPAMPNLHSHAFQRAFAGLTEVRSQPGDSFWSWRTLMYRFASRITPGQLEAIATWLYIEMLEAGYGSVCEFHYLHHDVDGTPYVDDAELSRCLMRAAATAGIGLTLLPVLYQTSGFGGKAPAHGQRRFIRSTDSMLRLIDTLHGESRSAAKATLTRATKGLGAVGPSLGKAADPAAAGHGFSASAATRIGLAPHSLRAVPPDSLREALACLASIAPDAPIHIHIAEQTKEVDDCIAWSGQRPVAWLLDHADLDARWCLVHATHMSAEETARAARTGAVAGLCPTTEANLGDGIFDAHGWLAAGGVYGIGSDSHACVNAAEELMSLEYSQRLALRQRNVLASEAHIEVATAMTLAAVRAGAQASGFMSSSSATGRSAEAGLAIGQPASFVTLDADHPSIAGLPAEQMLSAHVFASHRTSAIDTVWTYGHQRVQAGRHEHPDRRSAFDRFAKARAELLVGG
ncbi:MAG: formiminoglutamate deiminase [Rhizobacter sp.]|nr:formiminoglutamate deiminase [Rhizobacter sp.]